MHWTYGALISVQSEIWKEWHTPGGASIWRFVAVGFLACTGCGSDATVRSIPGTEKVATEAFSVSVSPDKRWIAFSEWVVPKARLEELPHGVSPLCIATMNLASGKIVRHAVDSIPAEQLGFEPDESGWRWELELIQNRFRPPGWRSGLFYLQPYFHGVWLVLDPSVVGVRIVGDPGGPGTCSDCPPMTWVRFRDRSWDLLSNEVSVVVRDGAVRAVYYVDSPYQRNQAHHRAVLRIANVGDEEVVTEAPARKRTMVVIGAVRASPDGQYLGYTVDSKEQAFFAGTRITLWIRDLVSGQEKKIATYGYMGNLIWSPDNRRLYFAGGEYDSDCAVRVVDVAATFAR